MDIRDLFVASVAFILGVMMIYSSILNDGWCFQMKVARVIADSKGRGKARTFIGSIGALMVLIGMYLALAPLAMNLFTLPNDRELDHEAAAGRMSFAEAD